MEAYSGVYHNGNKFSVIKTDEIDMILAAMMVDDTNSMERTLFTDNCRTESYTQEAVSMWRKPVIKNGGMYFRHKNKLVRVNGFTLWQVGDNMMYCSLYSDIDAKIEIYKYLKMIPEQPIETKEMEA